MNYFVIAVLILAIVWTIVREVIYERQVRDLEEGWVQLSVATSSALGTIKDARAEVRYARDQVEKLAS